MKDRFLLRRGRRLAARLKGTDKRARGSHLRWSAVGRELLKLDAYRRRLRWLQEEKERRDGLLGPKLAHVPHQFEAEFPELQLSWDLDPLAPHILRFCIAGRNRKGTPVRHGREFTRWAIDELMPGLFIEYLRDDARKVRYWIAESERRVPSELDGYARP